MTEKKKKKGGKNAAAKKKDGTWSVRNAETGQFIPFGKALDKILEHKSDTKKGQ